MTTVPVRGAVRSTLALVVALLMVVSFTGVASADDESSGTESANYGGCSVYANGGGMGTYCLHGGGALQTLSQRFGGQVLQWCRFSEIPKGMPVPFNSRPSEGRYMLQTCLGNINFNTFSGGPDKNVSVNVVWVSWGTNIQYVNNPISKFLWKAIEKSALLPIPFMVTHPNTTPVVGVPTFFTFRWIDPATRAVVAKGPYAGKADGGPYKRIDDNGFSVVAEAKDITVEPNQKGIPGIHCDPGTPYTEGAPASQQPAKACQITFPRSSASAQKLTTKKYSPDIDKDAFFVSVTVQWVVTYGRNGDMRKLGDVFHMRVMQVLPVQEIQAANQAPPQVIY